MNANLIKDLKERFPFGSAYRSKRIGNVDDWILQSGIEMGREEVIVYLMELWGVIEAPLEDPPYVRPSEDRIPADQYCTSPTAPYPEPGPGCA